MGISPAFLAGTLKSDDSAGGSTFSDDNDLKAFDVRGGVAYQLNNSFVLGGGLRAVLATHDATDTNFEPGVGGFNGEDDFKQTTIELDAGVRQFLSQTSSWEIAAAAGFGTSEKDVFSEDVDGAGATTGRFVSTNHDIDDLGLTVAGGYNRLRAEGLGEMEYRGGFTYTQRKLGNSDLALHGDRRRDDAGRHAAQPGSDQGHGDLRLGALDLRSRRDRGLPWARGWGTTRPTGASRLNAAGAIVNEKIEDSRARSRADARRAPAGIPRQAAHHRQRPR